jgi:hypothetical protein
MTNKHREGAKKYWSRFTAEERKRLLALRLKGKEFKWSPGTSPKGGRLGMSLARLAPTEHPTLLQIAWAAGVFEGEGHCRRYFNDKAKISRGSELVTVGQKDPWLCPRLRDLFGGTVRRHRRQNIEWHVWTLHGARARGFLMTIFTFLSPRRKQQVREALGSQPSL